MVDGDGGGSTKEREALGALALRRLSLACRECGGLRKPEEPASKTRSARILAPWSPGWVIGYTASPLCKLSCLIIGDQRCPPPSLNFSHCPSVVSPLLFAHCVGIGESGFASSHICYLLRVKWTRYLAQARECRWFIVHLLFMARSQMLLQVNNIHLSRCGCI